jgi:hypothetical protein
MTSKLANQKQHLAKKLHREGPSVLSIRDPNFLAQLKAPGHLMFGHRIRVLAKLVLAWKARADGLIKGDSLRTTVGAPLQALQCANDLQPE